MIDKVEQADAWWQQLDTELRHMLSGYATEGYPETWWQTQTPLEKIMHARIALQVH